MLSCLKGTATVAKYSSSLIKLETTRGIAASVPAMQNKFHLPKRYGAGEESVWVEYIKLAADIKPKVNLGQGFPDFYPPEHVTKGLAHILTDAGPLVHQYTRGFGHPKLVNVLSKVYSPLVGKEINPMEEILVTCGAYGALYSAIMGHVDVGDEVIVIEPFFDCYEPMIRAAGGTAKFIALKPKSHEGTMTSADWVLDEKELSSLFNAKTKMIIVNTPHNPLGKVFSCDELTMIANLCHKHNVVCLADEVYEWLTFDDCKHVRIASICDMWDRTITVGSAGKSFSVTGWKTGWAYGPKQLMKNLQVVHQNSVYNCNTPVQEALANAFECELKRFGTKECYFVSLAKDIKGKRDFFLEALKKNGFNPTVPQGGYFIMADWSCLEDKIDLKSEKDAQKDYRFTKKFAKESSVLSIPPTAFYSEAHKKYGEDYARFCFIKEDKQLQLAAKLITEWNEKKSC